MKILVLNAGSSSQKSAFYDLPASASDHPTEPLWEAKIDWTHREAIAEIEVKAQGGKTLHEERPASDRIGTLSHLLETLTTGDTQVIGDLSEIEAVGHRVVHGGQDYRESILITPEVKHAIARLSTFAPSHNPANLEGIEAMEHLLGTVPQIAVFDTAFHAGLPRSSAVYPIPYSWFEKGIRKYGFHGISHQYCANRAAQLLNRDLKELRIISCHLGNGCSLAAIREGRSIDTTMGFTPLDGLMMGSRSGSVDPGILIHLMREEQYSVDDLDHLLNKDSGLKGVSGISSDMRQVQAAIPMEAREAIAADPNIAADPSAEEHRATDSQAKLAVDIYIHRLQTGIGAMMAVLHGVDTLVFTGGVGENNADVRSRACDAFGFLGLKLDAEKNANHPIDEDIATPESTVRILVIHTEEDWAIAQKTQHLVCTL